MNRIININSRNYREPFLLIKVFKDKTENSNIPPSYQTTILQGSIMVKDMSNQAMYERDSQTVLSIKILKPSFEINTDCLVYRNNQIYEVFNVNYDQFNLQELKMECRYYQTLSEAEPSLIFAINNSSNAELEKALINQYVKWPQFEELSNKIDEIEKKVKRIEQYHHLKSDFKEFLNSMNRPSVERDNVEDLLMVEPLEDLKRNGD